MRSSRGRQGGKTVGVFHAGRPVRWSLGFVFLCKETERKVPTGSVWRSEPVALEPIFGVTTPLVSPASEAGGRSPARLPWHRGLTPVTGLVFGRSIVSTELLDGAFRPFRRSVGV